jgi:hypothetical protein
MPQVLLPNRQPYWLWKTKRLFPHPLFAGCVSAASIVVGILFMGCAIAIGVWPMGVVSLLFFGGAYATAAAAISRSPNDPVAEKVYTARFQKNKPTFAILVLLISVYTWLLGFAMLVADLFFKVDPGSIKYGVTLAIAIASTIYLRMHGNRIVREHFGANGGRKLELTSRQAMYVSLFVFGVSLYLLWIIF